MKRFLVLTVVAAALSLFAGVAAYAHTEGKGGPRKGDPMIWMLKKLDLTDAQKQQAKDIFGKHKAQIQPLVKQMVTERRVLRALVQADAVDEQAIRAQSARVSAANADLAVQRAYLFHELRGILTPDQLQKLKDLQAKWDRRIDRHVTPAANQE